MLEQISRRERHDLLIAWLAISLAFALIFINRGGGFPLFVIFFAVSLVTVGIGFVLHEMAHKFTAMRYGFRAEFRKDNQMLLVAVVLAALVGVVFAAPGATVIQGYAISREQNGRISAAGPVTNLLLCIPFIGLIVLGGGTLGDITSLIGLIGFKVNAMIAAFNMLPVSVLDGKKVLAWNPLVFGALIVAAFVVVFASFNTSEFLSLLL
ncbi:MAG: peptidase M50 [Methanomicrobiaceae archaeon]|nr:peptidase M50 [Methanomicrobiaceae archaeon]